MTYPDTEEGAKTALKAIAHPIVYAKLSALTWRPDKALKGVWGAGEFDPDYPEVWICCCIVYLAGYNGRQFSDFVVSDHL